MKIKSDVDALLKARVFLTVDELAERWNFSPATLRNWLMQGRGPTPTRIGAAVRYRLDRVEEFEAQGERGSSVVPSHVVARAKYSKEKGSHSKR
jgi:predicted site-specific integrase-resolvase